MMKIVLLDALTLGENLDLSVLSKFGKLEIYQTTTDTEITPRISNADIIITNKVMINNAEFQMAPKLKLICVAATGYNNIDLSSAREKGVVVANVRNYSTEAVAQHTFGLILALQNSLLDYVKETRSGNWSKSPVFCMLNHPFYELAGKKLGIIGYGTIGKRVAVIAKAFGMEVLVGKRPGIKYPEPERVEFETLIKESDIITIHTPLSENTLNLFTINELRKMKPSALLINVARGGIVNESDLYEALKNNIIRGAATDVTQKEPIEENNKLSELNNLLITPHMAWGSLESRQRLLGGIISNIEQFLAGNDDTINLA